MKTRVVPFSPIIKRGRVKICALLILLLSGFRIDGQCTVEGLDIACAGTTELYANTLTGTGLEYSWSLPTGGALIPNVDNSIYVSWNFPGIHTLSCDVTQSGQLVAACQIEVIVKEPPGGSLGFMPQGWSETVAMEVKNYCVGDNVDITLGLREPDPLTTFEWTFTGVSVSGQGAGTMANITFLEPGNVQVCVEASLANCSTLFCQNFRAYPIPDPVDFEIIESAGGIACGNQEIYFRNISDTNVPDDKWFWEVSDGTSTWAFQGRDLTFQFVAAGSHEISLQYMPYAYCSSEKTTKTLIIQNLLPLVVGCPTTVCFGETVTYELLTDCEDVTWEVSSEGTIISESGNEIEIAWENETGNHFGYISVVGTDCGPEYCTAPTVLTVPLFPPSMIAINGPDMLCGSYTYTVNGPPGASYLWTGTIISSEQGSITLSNGQSQSYQVNTGDFVGTINLNVVVSHPSLDCSSSDALEIDVYGVSIESADAVCHGSPFEVGITPLMPGMDIKWMLFYGNQFLYEIMDDDTYTIPADELEIPGVYTIRAELNNPPNQPCSLEKNFRVIAPITPIGKISGPPVVCAEQSMLYSVPNGEGHVNWIVHGGVLDNPNTSHFPVQLVTWDNTTFPKFLTVYRSFDGCQSESVTMFVELFTLNDIEIIGPGAACSDGTSEYTANFAGSTNFTWSLTPANIGSIVQIHPQDPSQVRIHWHFTDVPVQVVVQVTVEDCFEEEMFAEHTVTLMPFEFAILDNNGTSCAGDPIVFESNATTGNSWEWTIDGMAVSNNNGPVLGYTFPHPGEYLVEAVVENPDECGGRFTDAYVVSVQGLETPSLSTNPAFLCPDPAFPLEIVSSIGIAGNYTYEWLYEGNVIPGEDASTLAVNAEGIYTIIVSDGTCAREAEIQLVCSTPPPPCPCVPLLDVSINQLTRYDCGEYAVAGTLTGDFAAAFWTLPGNIIVPVTSSTPTLDNRFVTSPGYYSVMLTGIYACDPTGECAVFDTYLFEIPFVPNIAYVITCGNATGSEYDIHIEDASSVLPSANITSRQWTVNAQAAGNGTFIDRSEPAGNLLVVCLELQDASGYTCEKCIEIQIPEQPELNISTQFEGGCVSSVVEFMPELNPGAGSLIDWIWDFGDDSESRLRQPLKVYSTSGTYTVELKIHTVYGCTATASLPITVVTSPLNGILSKTLQDCNASALLEFTQTGGSSNITYTWSSSAETDADIQVMSNGIYAITVTDEFGCTYSTSIVVTEITEPFNMGVIPISAEHCMGTDFRLLNYVNNPFGGKWFITPDPLGLGVRSGHVFIPGTLPVGDYTITLQAIDKMTQMVCAMTTFPLQVHPMPDIALAHEVIYCEPFLAQVYETSGQIVEWTSPAVPPSSSILVTSHGTYSASITNSYNCSKTASITVEDDIDVTFFDAGCRKECIEDIIAGNVVVNGSDDTYDSWEWRVNGQVISSGMGSAPGNLTLTEQMVGSITLYIENGGCGKESGVHFVETMVCSDCPPELLVESVIYEIMLAFGDDECAPYVYYIRGKYLLPPGFMFCDLYPEFEDGYIIYDEFNYTYDPPINSVEFEAHMYITDFADYEANNGLVGMMQLCSTTSEDICPAKVKIKYQMPMMMMCNFEHCITMDCDSCDGLTLNQSVGVRSCTKLHFPACDDCVVDEYTVKILRGETVLYTEVVEWDGIGISQDYCLEYTYRYIGTSCYVIRIESNCGQYCNQSVCINSLDECEEYHRPIFVTPGDHEEGPVLFAFPNPGNGDQLLIDTGDPENILSMISLDGKPIFSDFHTSGSVSSIDTRELMPGTYLISAQHRITGEKRHVRYVHLAK